MTDYVPSEKYLKYKARRAGLQARRQAASRGLPTATANAGGKSPSNQATPLAAELTEQEFQAAIRLAKEYGVDVEARRPDPSASGVEGGELVLRDRNGNVIHRIPARLRPALGSAQISHKSRAIAWARSMGYNVQTKPDGFWAALMIGLGFFFFIVPGMLACIWVWMMNDSYEKNISTIIAKWIEAGMPDPGVKANIAVKMASTPKRSAAEQLTQYRALLARGLISDEEYQVLRSKALGLGSDQPDEHGLA